MASQEEHVSLLSEPSLTTQNAARLVERYTPRLLFHRLTSLRMVRNSCRVVSRIHTRISSMHFCNSILLCVRRCFGYITRCYRCNDEIWMRSCWIDSSYWTRGLSEPAVDETPSGYRSATYAIFEAPRRPRRIASLDLGTSRG
jgi:hypothetical protein